MAEQEIEDTGSTGPIVKVSPKKMQPKWATPPSYEDLHSDYIEAEDGMDDYRAKLSIWNETLEGGKAIKTSKLGKSTARPLLARKQAEWRYPALSEPILGTRDLFKISPVEFNDSLGATQNSLLLNNQWSTKVKKVSIVDDIVRNIVDEGTVIVKTGWDSEYALEMVSKEEPIYASPEESLMLMQQAVQAGELSPEEAQAMLETGEPVQTGVELIEIEEEVLVKNQPSYEVCINANVTIDPTCDGVIEDAMFAIHEFDTSYAELKADEYVKDENGETGFYYNIERLFGEDSDEYDEFKSDASNNFNFKDKARKRLRAYEYWGYWDIQGDGELVAIVATWVGNTIVRLQENPFPHGRIPFSVAKYMPVKRDVHGEPDAELLKENQDAIGNMTRAINDITAKQAVGQEFIDENFFPSPSQKNAYEKGNTVYYRSGFKPKESIFKSEIQQVGSTPFDVINWQQQDASELTGTKAFTGSQGGGKLSGTSQQRDSMDATAKRELSILRRISEMFVDMARMTISMNQAFLSEEEVVRITGKEFVTIKRDDLEGNFDLSVEVSTPEKDEDQAGKIMKLMQTNAANMDAEISNMHYVQMAELWKLPELAEKVRSHQPTPDPAQVEMAQLQLEEQKLKNAILMKELEDMDSKIYERLSRTEENSEADVAMKQAKAEQSLAAAEKLRSEADKIDQEYLDTQSGKKRLESIEDQEFSAATKAEQLSIKSNNAKA
jgi:hypothetical protein